MTKFINLGMRDKMTSFFNRLFGQNPDSVGQAIMNGYSATCDDAIEELYGSEPNSVFVGKSITPDDFEQLFKCGYPKNFLLELMLTAENAGVDMDNFISFCTPAAMKEFLMR